MTIGRTGVASFLVAASAALMVSCATAPLRATSASSGGPASADRPDADQALANTISAELSADPTYYFRHVEVRVDRGVAQLSGYVWSTDAIYRARQVARSVPGITSVVTAQLELERNGRSNGVAR